VDGNWLDLGLRTFPVRATHWS